MPLATHDRETLFIDNVRQYRTGNDLSTLRVDGDGDSFEVTLFDEDGAHWFALDIDEQELLLAMLLKMSARRGTRP